MSMSDAQKKAIAASRAETLAVKRYLEYLNTPKPPKARTPDGLKTRIEELATKIASEDDPLRKVELTQARLDAEHLLSETEATTSPDKIIGGFKGAVVGYSARKNISYSAWREVGVPADLLIKAGVPRTRRN